LESASAFRFAIILSFVKIQDRAKKNHPRSELAKDGLMFFIFLFRQMIDVIGFL